VSRLGAGRGMAELRNRIEQLRSEIAELGPAPADMPGMIESANLLRRNEHLLRSDSSKTELLSCYEEYASSLEAMLRSVLEIQNELRDVLRDQSRLISEGPKSRPRRAAGRRAGRRSP